MRMRRQREHADKQGDEELAHWYASFEVGGFDTNSRVAAVNAALCVAVDTDVGNPGRKLPINL